MRRSERNETCVKYIYYVYMFYVHLGYMGKEPLRALDGVNTRFGKHVIIKCER